MTEQELLREIIGYAGDHEVLAYHAYDSRKTSSRGFPDLVLAGMQHLVFVETKGDRGQLSPEQVEWKYRILASGNYHSVVRPQDLPRLKCAIANL